MGGYRVLEPRSLEAEVDMKKLRVLHLASFVGNIGDNANHLGFHRKIAAALKFSLEFTQLEIRDFYRGTRAYDDQFVDYVNTFDLFIVGGGNYFELWPTNSPSGTSVGFSIEQLARFNCPVLFNALGIDIGQGIGVGSREKFRNFLDYCLKSPRVFISVRNDGAIENVKKIFGDYYANRILQVPDSGFFLETKLASIPYRDNKPWVGINVASDMPEIRYSRFGIESFMNNIRDLVVWLSEGGYKSVFLPHIPTDFYFIYEILSGLKNDKILRENVVIAPVHQGDSGLFSSLNYYSNCSHLIATRFHSNIFGIVLGIPTICLNTYIQLENLYHELKLPEQLIGVNDPNFIGQLKAKFLKYESPDQCNNLITRYAEIGHENENSAEKYSRQLNIWLEKCNL